MNMRPIRNAACAALAAAALGGCVMPFDSDIPKMLLAKTRQYSYPLFYDFNAAEELSIKMVNDLGETRGVAAQNAGITFDNDFGSVGEKRGTVEYRGATAEFEVFVYDPTQIGATPVNPDGPTIVIVVD